MPYIFVENLPDGTEEADVVSRTDYDSVVEERDNTITQRDEALQRIATAEQEMRDTKAKYAEYVLSNHNKSDNGGDKNDKVTKPTRKMSSSDLFRKEQ